MTDAQRSRSEPGRIPAPSRPRSRDDGIPVDTEPDEFRSLVRAWFDEHAPAKGGPDDFSNVHVVERVDDRGIRRP